MSGGFGVQRRASGSVQSQRPQIYIEPTKIYTARRRERFSEISSLCLSIRRLNDKGVHLKNKANCVLIRNSQPKIRRRQAHGFIELAGRKRACQKKTKSGIRDVRLHCRAVSWPDLKRSTRTVGR